jgi:hypothetical protein
MALAHSTTPAGRFALLVVAPRAPRRRFGLGALLAEVSLLGICLANAAACSGPGAQLGCPAIDACGGSPQDLIGNWQLQSPDSYCVYIPPLTYTVPTNNPPLTFVPAQAALAQTPSKATPPKSAGDWCYSLEYLPPAPADAGFTMGGVVTVTLPIPPGGIAPAAALGDAGPPVLFSLQPNNTYAVYANTLAYAQGIHFAPPCLTAFGATPTCSDLTSQTQAYLTAHSQVAFRDFSCVDSADGGCDCSYEYAGEAADQGSWRVSGTVLYFLSESNATQQVVATDFCSQRNSLVISGHNGISLFNDHGLRTLMLMRAQ